MKAAVPVLSAAQRRAQEKYKSAIVPAMFVAMLGDPIVAFPISMVFRRFISPSGSTVTVPLILISFLLAHLWAVREVRRAALSLESREVEVLTRANPGFQDEGRNWHYPKTWIGSLGNASFPVLMSGIGWLLWHWPWPSHSPVDKWLGILCFWLFTWISLVNLIFLRSPHVRIDEDGIAAFPHPLWRRRAHWRDIAQCEISTRYDFMGRGPTRFFYFRSANGKILLRLIPGSLAGLSRDEQAEIEREIRKRLGTQ